MLDNNCLLYAWSSSLSSGEGADVGGKFAGLGSNEKAIRGNREHDRCRITAGTSKQDNDKELKDVFALQVIH
jgi:hypothetical protein